MQLTHSKFYHYLKDQKYCIRTKESKTFIFSINFNIFTLRFVAQIVMNFSNQGTLLNKGVVKKILVGTISGLLESLLLFVRPMHLQTFEA